MTDGEYYVMVLDTMDSMSLKDIKSWSEEGTRSELEASFKYFMKNEMLQKASIIYNML